MCTTRRSAHLTCNQANQHPFRRGYTRRWKKQNGLLDSQMILSFEARSQKPRVKKSELSAKTDSNVRNWFYRAFVFTAYLWTPSPSPPPPPALSFLLNRFSLPFILPVLSRAKISTHGSFICIRHFLNEAVSGGIFFIFFIFYGWLFTCIQNSSMRVFVMGNFSTASCSATFNTSSEG